jgi:hypothetical protein
MTGVAIAMVAGIAGWVVAATRRQRRMAERDGNGTVATGPDPKAELRPVG